MIDVGDWAAPNVNQTAALQACLNEAKQTGQSVHFPAGVTFCHDSPLSLQDAYDLVITAEAGPGARPAPNLTYTGGGTEPALHLGSAHGVAFRDFTYTHSSDEMTGPLMRLGWGDAFNRDASRIVFDHCVFTGTGTADALIDLNRCTFVSISNCYLRRAQHGLLGAVNSNVVHVHGGTAFSQISQWPIYNPGIGWAVSGCSFAARPDGSAAAIASDVYTRGLAYSGNYHGDIQSPGGSWADLLTLNASIQGNYFGGHKDDTRGAIRFKGNSSGITIVGNTFDSNVHLEAAPNPGTPNLGVTGVAILGNTFRGNLANTADQVIGAGIFQRVHAAANRGLNGNIWGVTDGTLTSLLETLQSQGLIRIEI